MRKADNGSMNKYALLAIALFSIGCGSEDATTSKVGTSEGGTNFATVATIATNVVEGSVDSDGVNSAECASGQVVTGGGCECATGVVFAGAPAGKAYVCGCTSGSVKPYANCMTIQSNAIVDGEAANGRDPAAEEMERRYLDRRIELEAGN